MEHDLELQAEMRGHDSVILDLGQRWACYSHHGFASRLSSKFAWCSLRLPEESEYGPQYLPEIRSALFLVILRSHSFPLRSRRWTSPTKHNTHSVFSTGSSKCYCNFYCYPSPFGGDRSGTETVLSKTLGGPDPCG